MPKAIIINLDKKYSKSLFIHHLICLIVTIFSYMVVLSSFEFCYVKDTTDIILYAVLYYLMNDLIKRLVFKFKDFTYILLIYPFIGIASILFVTWLFDELLIFKGIDSFFGFYILASLIKFIILKIVDLLEGGKNGTRI